MANAVEIRIGADASQAKRELSSLGGAFGSVGSSLKSMINPATVATAAVAALGAGALLLGKGLLDVANSVSEAGDRIAKTAKIAGVGGEQFQALSFAAERAGVETSALSGGLTKLAKNLFDANTGNTRMAQTFAGMGIATKTATGELRSASDVFRDIADHVQRTGTSAQTTGELMTILGKSGAELTNVLLGGSEELDRMEQRLRSLGGVMSQEALDASEAYQDALLDLNTSVTGLKNDIGSALLPTLTAFVLYTTDTAIPAMKRLGESMAGALLDAKPVLDWMLNRLSANHPILAALGRAGLDIAAAGGMVPQPSTGGSPPPRPPPRPPPPRGSGAASAAVQAGANGQMLGAANLDDIEVERPMADFIESMWLDSAARIGDGWVEMEARRQQATLDSSEAIKRALEEEVETARRANEAQYVAASSLFSGIEQMSSAAQSIVEDSYLGQTKAGRAAAKALFIVTKAAALAGAAVNTGLAITNTLANIPAPANIGAAVGVGIAGAAQIALIAASAIQGVADAGLPPGALRAAGLGQHTVLAVRNDEMVLGPRDTSEVSEMLALQRRQMEAGQQSANQSPVVVAVEMDGRRLTRALAPHETRAIEDGYDPRRNVRFGVG